MALAVVVRGATDREVRKGRDRWYAWLTPHQGRGIDPQTRRSRPRRQPDGKPTPFAGAKVDGYPWPSVAAPVWRDMVAAYVASRLSSGALYVLIADLVGDGATHETVGTAIVSTCSAHAPGVLEFVRVNSLVRYSAPNVHRAIDVAGELVATALQITGGDLVCAALPQYAGGVEIPAVTRGRKLYASRAAAPDVAAAVQDLGEGADAHAAAPS